MVHHGGVPDPSITAACPAPQKASPRATPTRPRINKGEVPPGPRPCFVPLYAFGSEAMPGALRFPGQAEYSLRDRCASSSPAGGDLGVNARSQKGDAGLTLFGRFADKLRVRRRPNKP